MASVKNLKKDINHTLGDIIEECYIWALLNPEAEAVKSEAIIDEAIEAFDGLINKVHAKDVDNRKKHFKAISAELESKAGVLVGKINSL